MTAIPMPSVSEALKSVAGAQGKCTDKGCLVRLAEVVKAQDAIGVAVQDRTGEDGPVRVEITMAYVEGSTFERDSFFIALEEIQRVVSVALLKRKEEALAEDPQPDTTPTAAQEPEVDTNRLRPVAFWTSVGITGALVVGYLAAEITYNVKRGALEDQSAVERSQGDWDSLHRTQVADRVLFGCALGGIAVSTVLFFFTDFNEEDEGGADKVEISVTPGVSANGGFIAATGRF
jgi:hypothetical protein